jgi:4-alpha-glucanotransferase
MSPRLKCFSQKPQDVLMTRDSGILLHPTSLPGPYGIGELGSAAFAFIDFLADSQQTVWQILPLGPTSYGNSPYQCLSAFAGNPLLISLEHLYQDGYLTAEEVASVPAMRSEAVDFAQLIPWKNNLLQQAYQRFKVQAKPSEQQALQQFCEQHHHWLQDYAQFAALKDFHDGKSWIEWAPALAQRDLTALQQWCEHYPDELAYQTFLQHQFFRQWQALKRYANQKGIKIIGDLPIFVAYDSADVWANPHLFKLDAEGHPTVIAGVPPDYFSATGQRWGNPLYNWKIMAADDYHWWRRRFAALLDLVDWIRIDHFRGFEQNWEIAADEATAQHGKWVDGPKLAFFQTMERYLGQLPIIAENLGVITQSVEKLRIDCGFPGMKVLQFAFLDEDATEFLPHNYEQQAVVYTGTHDNNTTRGWFDNELNETDRERIRNYVDKFFMGEAASAVLMRLAWASTAMMAIAPMQDVLNLGQECRINLPGHSHHQNWTWRYRNDQLTPEITVWLSHLSTLYERLGDVTHHPKPTTKTLVI